jgi:hypothetical protein
MSTPIYILKSSILMSTTSITVFWYIYERAYEKPKWGILISTLKYVLKSSILMSTTSITVFWYIYAWACLWETPIRDPHKHARICTKLIQYSHEHDQYYRILVYIWACLWETQIRDPHKHTQICILKSSILMSTTCITVFWYIYERAYEKPK